MASSTEDYLDSLLRQAMGIEEPPVKPQPDTSDLAPQDVLAMADGLTGSNSAILGNAYDHNASFTNAGEIDIPATEEPTIIPEEPIIPEVFSVPEETVVPESVAAVAAEDIVIPDVDEAPVELTIPDSPVVEHDGNLDIIPEPSMMPEIEMPQIEEPIVAEEPVPDIISLDEPVAEEPVVEEPVLEEIPAVEEPVVAEEPVPDMISLDELVAEELVNEEPILEDISEVEEPVIEEEPVAAEEPVIEEEPVAAEEPVIAEEPAAEEPAPEEIATDDPSIELDPIIIDPLGGEPAEEEPAEDESATEEAEAGVSDPEFDLLAGDDNASLEELSIQIDDPEETPLMPDQEISDLLSTLGELSGDSGDFDENAGEEAAEESADAPSEEEVTASADETEGADLGGIDVFDTDLSAMLDDVTNSLDAPEGEGSAEGASDQDLNDLLGSLDDGSGDLSDIGDLLNKDENSELVDPNTETAEALFASDSEEDIFNIENLIDEEEGSGKKKKKKRKFSLFGKKKKSDSNIEVIGGDEEMLIDPDFLDIPDESEIKPKKPGFFATLFAKLFEEVGEDEEAPVVIDQSAVDIAAEGAAENEAILSELDEEGAGDDKKKKKKEKKKKEKKGKKEKEGGEAGGEEGEGEEAAEDTKKKKKKEKKKKEKLPEIPGKRLPRKKVVAISLFCITIGIVITFLSFMIPYSKDIEKAKKFYTTGEYQKTYEYMRGHKLTSDDQILYDRTITLLRIKRPYDSYQNYMKMGLRMEALNALVQGVQMSDRYMEEAASLGIIDKYSKQSRMIYDELYNTFGVTVERARGWIELEGTPEYTRAVYEALLDSSGISKDEQELPDGEQGEEEDPVIKAEENDL